MTVAADKVPKPFDFTQTGMARKKKESLERMHADFAVSLGSTLVSYITLPTQVVLKSIQQQSYESYQKSVEGALLFSLFDIEPMEMSGLLRMDAAIVLAAIDRILGGEGVAPATPRDLSLIELKMAEALMAKILNQLNGAWELFGEFSFKLKSNAQLPGAFRFLAPEESVLVITFDVTVKDVKGIFQACFPFAFVKPFLTNLEKSQERPLGDLRDPKIACALQTRFEDIQVPLQVILGEQELSLKDLTSLERGDVIRLVDVATLLTATVGNVPVFQVAPGISNKKMAVRVSSAAPEMGAA